MSRGGGGVEDCRQGLQSGLEGLHSSDLCGPWGDVLAVPKPDYSLRICFQNVGGLPPSNVHVKNSQLISFVNSHQVDVLALSESNIAWHCLPFHQRLPKGTCGWWESLHLSLAYYQDDHLARLAFQPGGTAIFSIAQAAHRVHSSGGDPSGLGCWTWTRYVGKGQVALRIISAYRCVHSASGPLLAFNRQRAYFYQQNDDRCPHLAFSEDLALAVSDWLTMGDQLVLMADVNDPIFSCDLTSRLGSLGLSKVFLSNHSSRPPATFHQGQVAIDTIYVSASLLPSRSGYMAFGAAISANHRALWIDIPYHLAFGHRLPILVHPQA